MAIVVVVRRAIGVNYLKARARILIPDRRWLALVLGKKQSSSFLVAEQDVSWRERLSAARAVGNSAYPFSVMSPS